MDIQHHHSHETQIAHKVEHDVQTHNMQALRHDLSQEAHHPHEFQKVMHDVNQHLKHEHHHPLSIHHDKNGHISHIDFGKTNIYDRHHGAHGAAHKNKVEHKNIEGKPEALEPSQRAHQKDMEREKGGDKPLSGARADGPQAAADAAKAPLDAAPKAPLDAAPKAPTSPKGTESAEYAAYRNEQAVEKMDPSLRKDALTAFNKLGHLQGINNEGMERNRQQFIDFATRPDVPLASKQQIMHHQATLQ